MVVVTGAMVVAMMIVMIVMIMPVVAIVCGAHQRALEFVRANWNSFDLRFVLDSGYGKRRSPGRKGE
jgi:hypothetical protein